MKDRVALNSILAAKENGELKDDGIIIESSSGTLAIGLALVGRTLRHEVHIVLDPRVDALTLAKLRTLGAIVHMVEQMTEGGWQGTRRQKVLQLMEEHPGAFWPRQFTSIQNPLSYTQLAKELLEDVNHIDALVGPVGSGGSLCGSARFLRKFLPDLLVVGVDAVGSITFDQPDLKNRLQSGLGNSIISENVDKTLIDQVHWLNDEEAFNATLQLAASEQIFAGNSSGSAYLVACWLSTQMPLESTIAVIFPDRGDRYFRTIYNPDYWRDHNLTRRCISPDPKEVPYGTIVKE
ncbi:cysteine synthase family protein [Ktedonosporobacter rubrisoli]|uniref:Cysteine synthase family protein n=2 Tax=Ktedonosporobacter rubrisoli TaxID=2509675 RepID=A0A4P6K5V0_KTERU|nr:cysteine synthase family protein [Ktedonosporobacter rubrisoli]